MRATLCLLATLLLAAPAHSGAWPREKGAFFFSLGHTTGTGLVSALTPEMQINRYTSLYAEYGLSETLTLGATGGFGGDADYTAREALVFVRRPIWHNHGAHRFAADIGVGMIGDTDQGAQPRLRAGLAWGRGFTARWGDGWMGIEASADRRLSSRETALKADFTAGLKPHARTMLIFQIQSSRYPRAEPQVRLVPSYVRQIGKRFHAQLGAFADVTGGDSVGLKTALWASF